MLFSLRHRRNFLENTELPRCTGREAPDPEERPEGSAGLSQQFHASAPDGQLPPGRKAVTPALHCLLLWEKLMSLRCSMPPATSRRRSRVRE